MTTLPMPPVPVGSWSIIWSFTFFVTLPVMVKLELSRWKAMNERSHSAA